MFPIDPYRRTVGDLHIIAHDEEVLLEDTMPRVITGINRYGARVTSLLALDNDKKSIERYYHTIADSVIFSEYLGGRASYLELMTQSSEGLLFIEDRSYDGAQLALYVTSVRELSPDLLPGEGSYLPFYEAGPAIEFDFQLQGQLAQRHEATPRAVGRVSASGAELVTISFNAMEIFAGTRSVVKAMPAGSFIIRVGTSSELQKDLFATADAESVNAWPARFIQYCLNWLPREAQAVFHREKTARIQQLEEVLVLASGGRLSPQRAEEKVLDACAKALEELEDISGYLGDGFEYLEVRGHDADRQDQLLGTVSHRIRNSLVEANAIAERALRDVKIDRDARWYDGVVYYLNTESRKCSARVVDGEDLPKVTLSLPAEIEMRESPITESLHLDRSIRLLGKGTRVDGKLKRIDVESVRA